MTTAIDSFKLENQIIVKLIRKGSSVLDLGCGDGELLAELKKEKSIVQSQGIEIDEHSICKCVAKGLSVFHGDIDDGLSEYADSSFNYVILNQSLQQVRNPDKVLGQSLRVGREVIVSFPNFAYISARFDLAFKGVTPITRSLPFEWYNSPNLHFLSIADFIHFCRSRNIKIVKAIYVGNIGFVRLVPNLLASVGVFLITKTKP
jgi:methionine biosynthesis protein MetW